MKEFEFIQSIDDDKSLMRIDDKIGKGGIEGKVFVDELAHVASFNTQVKLHIASGGGAMTDGYLMFFGLDNLSKKMNVDITITGLAASMAQLLSLAGTGLPDIVDYGMLLIHKPRIAGNPNPKDKFLAQGIDTFFESALIVISGKTGISKEILMELMEANDGEGTWLNADAAFKLGLTNEPIKTEPSQRIAAGITEDVNLQSFYMGLMKPDEDELVINKTEIYNMEKVLLELNLDLKAKEEDAVEMVVSLKADKEKAELKAETLEARVTEQDLVIASFEAAKIESFIDSKIESKQIKAEDKAKWLDRATKNYDMVSEVLNDLPSPTVVADITTVIEAKPTETVESFRDLEKTNPAKLEQIKKDNIELYNKMYELEYKN